MKKLLLILPLLLLWFPSATHAAFADYIPITQDHTKVGATDSSNFPMLISGTYPKLKTVANGGDVWNVNGYDIGFYTNSDCSTGKMNWETETWSATTGAVNYWVKIATLSHSADTVFYMCYSDSTITTDQSSATSVWDSNYKAVYHLPDGTTLSANDSTATPANGTLINTPTAVTGQVDGGAGFASASQQYISLGNPAKLQISGATDLMITFWTKVVSTGGTYDFVSKDKDTGGRAYTLDANGGYRFYIAGGDGLVSKAIPDSTNWHYVYGSYKQSNKATQIGYDLVAPATATAGGTIPTATSNVDIGRREYAGNNDYLNGNMDEVRIMTTIRSADWLTAEYNNGNSPSTFYTAGAQVGPDVSRFQLWFMSLF